MPVNHEVLDDDFCSTSASSSSGLPSTNGMSLTICPNLGFSVTPSTVISSLNHPGLPNLYDPWMWDGLLSSPGHSCHNSQQHYSTQLAPAPKLRTTYQCYHYKPSTRHPPLLGTFILLQCEATAHPHMHSQYVHHSHSTTMIKQDSSFVFGPEMSTSDVLLYKEPPHASCGQPNSILFYICPLPPFFVDGYVTMQSADS
ncbi:hypothetical protein BDR07DRAFT_1482330 [Suillus spraguei]|nr:hypothetical protein BDR07DRAFT_1482330 [Suillus spraguei]